MQYATPRILGPTPNLVLTERVLLFYGIFHATVGTGESQGDEEEGDTEGAIEILG